MHRPGTLIAAVSFGILSPVPAGLAAQGAQGTTDLAAVCKSIGDAKPGQWASFDGSSASGSGKLRLALVGAERSGDSTLYWLEVNFAGEQGHSGVVQLLTPSLAAAGAPRAVVLKLGDQPAMKLSGEMASMMSRKGTNTEAFDWPSRCAGAHVVGWESVTVPAGTFRALHVTTDDGDVWASRDVPFGFVKMHGKQGDLVLAARGVDAKSSITERPIEMPNLMTKP